MLKLKVNIFGPQSMKMGILQLIEIIAYDF